MRNHEVNRRDIGRFALGAILATRVSAQTASPDARAESENIPWRADPSNLPLREERQFRSGDETLGGTLTLPRRRRRVGAVVVFHGASSPLRSSPLYRHLVEMLPALGLAVFLYDRRGSGASGGDRGSASFEDLADDGIAAVDMLRRDPRIDPGRIGVWGLSQGGWLAMLAAARSRHVGFAIAVSAPVVTADVQMLFSSTNTLRVFGHTQQDIDQMVATRTAVDNYMRGAGDRATAQAAVDRARLQPWFRYLYMGETVPDREVSQWRREIEHDPMATIAQIRQPLLVLYGAVDPVVPVAASVARLAGMEPRYPNRQLAVIADADHSMQTDVSPRDQLDPARADDGRPNAAEYFATLAAWLTARGLTLL